jgi:hypothetical protein
MLFLMPVKVFRSSCAFVGTEVSSVMLEAALALSSGVVIKSLKLSKQQIPDAVPLLNSNSTKNWMIKSGVTEA